MGETKWTAGPWDYQGYDWKRDMFLIRTRNGTSRMRVMLDDLGPFEERGANIRLMVAAPDLLAALLAIREYHTCFCDYHSSQLSDYPMTDHDEFCKQAQAAVIKAGGPE